MSVKLVCRVLGDVVTLTKATIVVGRGSEADLRVDDSDVSRRHCEFTLSPRGLVIRDLGSTHGTWVRGRRVSGEIRVTQLTKVVLGEGGAELEILSATVDGRNVLDDALPAGGDGTQTMEVPGGNGRTGGSATAPSSPMKDLLLGAAIGAGVALALLLLPPWRDALSAVRRAMTG